MNTDVSGDQESPRPRKRPMTAKWREVLARLRFAINTIGIDIRSSGIDSLTLYNAYHASMNPNWRPQKAEDPRYIEDARLHDKLFGTALEEVLGLLAIPVNRKAIQEIGHGGSPDCDEIKNDAFWRACLPMKDYPAVGWVTFVKGSYPQHPLVKAYFKSGCKPFCSGLDSLKNKAIKAQNNGLAFMVRREALLAPTENPFSAECN